MFSKKESNFCVHCEPLIERHDRLGSRFIFYSAIIANTAVGIIDNFVSPHSERFRKFEKKMLDSLMRVLIKIGIAKIVPIKNKEEIQGRSLTIVDEAVKRGYSVNLVKFFNKHLNIFQLNFRNKLLFFHVLPSLDSHNAIDFSDKYLFKLFLRSNNLPHVHGKVFRDINKALHYGDEIGYPLVVKPRFGSLSRHTSTNIENRDGLKEAIRIVKIITNEFIVERHIEGKNYRAVVIGNKMVACALREPANVTGDGFNTVEQLIMIKNDSPLRGSYYQKSFTLKKINITPRIEELLMQKNYTLKSIPLVGKKIYLDTKVVLSGGADIHDVTDVVHEVNVKLLEELSIILKTSLVGFDLITPDISKPYHDMTFVVIEANSSPYIDMHHFPISGTPRNVAARIIDSVESRYFSA